MKPRFELKVNYKNKDQPLVFRAEGTLEFCCEEILDILCDEITSVTIKTTSDLLAQKEDRKECKHKLGDKEEHDTLGTYHIAEDTCVKCGKHIMDWDNSTHSPLELPKINNNFSSMEQYNWAKQITDEVNKLYQFIKEKL